ncbi:unnamed protein product [Leuciscus chuanchicus]
MKNTLILLQTKHGFSGLSLRMRSALVSGRQVALMTLCFEDVQFFCGQLFPCSDLVLHKDIKLCCVSVCRDRGSVMALLLRASVRGYFTSALRRGSDQLGDLGSGAGKGGGAGGSVREAGGAFGKKQAADEERYFKQKEKEQLAALKKHHEEEIDHHKKEIERLQREIDRHKGKIRRLKHDD